MTQPPGVASRRIAGALAGMAAGGALVGALGVITAFTQRGTTEKLEKFGSVGVGEFAFDDTLRLGLTVLALATFATLGLLLLWHRNAQQPPIRWVAKWAAVLALPGALVIWWIATLALSLFGYGSVGIVG